MNNLQMVWKIEKLWERKPGNNIASVEQADRHVLSRPECILVFSLLCFLLFLFSWSMVNGRQGPRLT